MATLALLASVWVGAGCGPQSPEREEPAIDRETFVRIQVELHLAVLDSEEGEVPPARRDSIFREHGVDEEALRAFLAVHGNDEAYMAGVWADVDERVREALGIGPGEPGGPEIEAHLHRSVLRWHPDAAPSPREP